MAGNIHGKMCFRYIVIKGCHAYKDKAILLKFSEGLEYWSHLSKNATASLFSMEHYLARSSA